MTQPATHNPNMIHFYCYYPHYSGHNCSGSGLIDATALLMMLTIAAEQYQLLSNNGTQAVTYDSKSKLCAKKLAQYYVLDETLDELLEDVAVTLKSSYALSDAIRGNGFCPSDVLAGLTQKGFYADEWEEGSFYLATNEALPKAQKQLNKIEADHYKDTGEF